MNALTLRAGSDLCGDESSWPFGGCGEAKSGLTGLVANKLGVNRGGQIVVLSSIATAKLHDFAFSFAGASEVKLMWDIIKPVCADPNELEVDDAAFEPKMIFSEFPHFTWENCFSGDALLHCATKEGFGLTMTCRRDCLPRGAPSKCM